MFGGVEVTKKKLGGLGKLSQFSGIKPQIEEVKSQKSNVKIDNSELKTPNSELKKKLVTVNVKITKAQKDWLAETASQVRDNNLEPVPPALRVYPQHLIGVAIDLLQAAEVDWDKVKSIGDLLEHLNL